MTRFDPEEMRLAPPLVPPPPGAAVKPRTALLVNPFYRKDPVASFGKHVLTPSLALTTVAAATPPGWEVSIHDENLLQGPPPCSPVPEVVGITVHLTFARRAWELARFYRRLGSKVVAGGPHLHSRPEEAAVHCDAVAVGDGAHLWPRILADVERNELRTAYRAPSGALPGPGAPPPRRDLLPRGSFLTTASVIATEGCRSRCDFCWLATDGLRLPVRAREPRDVAAEIAATGEPYAVFLDNNLGADRELLRRLCGELAPLGIIWSAAVSLDVTGDPSLLREMALSGCTGVFVGFETLSDESLSAARKRTPRVEEYARRVAALHEHGIQVNGSFVFGFDADGPDVFERTVAWIEEARLECATFHVLTPYPGTPLFARLEAEGRILTRDWTLYDTTRAVFRPARMTPRQLEAGHAWAYRRLFSRGSIWHRRPEDLRAVPAYLAGALLYKKANRLWLEVIRRRLVGGAWRPLVELSRRRHLAFRRRLARDADGPLRAGTPIAAGV